MKCESKFQSVSESPSQSSTNLKSGVMDQLCSLSTMIVRYGEVIPFCKISICFFNPSFQREGSSFNSREQFRFMNLTLNIMRRGKLEMKPPDDSVMVKERGEERRGLNASESEWIVRRFKETGRWRGGCC